MLEPFLADADAGSLVTRAQGLTTRQLEAMLAQRKASAPRRDRVRFVSNAPSPPAAGAQADEEQAPLLTTGSEEPKNLGSPVPTQADDRRAEPRPPVRIAFTAGFEFFVHLEKARSLLRHKYPDGRPEGVLGAALRALLEKKDPGIRWARRGRPKRGPGPLSPRSRDLGP